MTNFSATNVALYNLGGSGDNLIPNGYVKAVEKVWIDSFTFSAVLTTADTVCIAQVPAGCKIVGVEAFFPYTFLPTASLINIGMSYSTSLLVSSAALNLAVNSNYKVTMNNPAGMNFVPTSSTSTVSGGTVVLNATQGVYLSLGVTALTAPTAGTIQTIVRYT